MMRNGLLKALIISLALVLTMSSLVVFADKPVGGVHNHGDDSEDPTGDPTVTNNISMVKTAFVPDNVLADSGSSVTWTNNEKGKKRHTVNIDALNFHSGDIFPGEVFVFADQIPKGTYTVYCSIHSGMTMTLAVQ